LVISFKYAKLVYPCYSKQIANCFCSSSSSTKKL